MSTIDLLALLSPVLPAALLVLILSGRWWRGAIAPLTFAVFVGETVLAAAAGRPAAQIVAAGGVLVALGGLLAIVFREERMARRAAAMSCWEDFERAFRAYARDTRAHSDRPPSSK
jgi:hypothetical protein